MIPRRSRRMAARSKTLVFGLVLLFCFGTAVYYRLWTIDYSISKDEAQLLRRQFDLANREAMDEAAEWRLKYDTEVERATKCQEELIKAKESFREKGAAGIDQKLEMLKKIESLKKELKAEQVKCKSRPASKT